RALDGKSMTGGLPPGIVTVWFGSLLGSKMTCATRLVYREVGSIGVEESGFGERAAGDGGVEGVGGEGEDYGQDSDGVSGVPREKSVVRGLLVVRAVDLAH